ncbi:MAG: ATP-binding cassette domain-containing protein [Bacteroidales bacterium]
MNIVEVKDVSKSFSNHKALDKVSLDIKKGIIFGLLGPNGAGKTTLIRILNQITAPDSGTILFNGEPFHRKDIEQIGYLPEERGLYKKMKVGEQALYLAQLKGLSKEEAFKRLKQWFIKFEIQDWWNRKIEELSKGMQQKVQFIITVIHEPEFLILDEPFSGFDPINTNLLKEEILELKKKGATIIISTHNMASVEEICDEIALINKSKKILSGNLTEIKQRFKQHIFQIELLKNEELLIDIPSTFEVLNSEQAKECTQYQVKIPATQSSNDLLQFFMQHGTILSFKEILPSMNDIFIQQVENYNRMNSHE